MIDDPKFFGNMFKSRSILCPVTNTIDVHCSLMGRCEATQTTVQGWECDGVREVRKKWRRYLEVNYRANDSKVYEIHLAVPYKRIKHSLSEIARFQYSYKIYITKNEEEFNYGEFTEIYDSSETISKRRKIFGKTANTKKKKKKSPPALPNGEIMRRGVLNHPNDTHLSLIFRCHLIGPYLTVKSQDKGVFNLFSFSFYYVLKDGRKVKFADRIGFPWRKIENARPMGDPWKQYFWILTMPKGAKDSEFLHAIGEATRQTFEKRCTNVLEREEDEDDDDSSSEEESSTSEEEEEEEEDYVPKKKIKKKKKVKKRKRKRRRKIVRRKIVDDETSSEEEEEYKEVKKQEYIRPRRISTRSRSTKKTSQSPKNNNVRPPPPPPRFEILSSDEEEEEVLDEISEEEQPSTEDDVFSDSYSKTESIEYETSVKNKNVILHAIEQEEVVAPPPVQIKMGVKKGPYEKHLNFAATKREVQRYEMVIPTPHIIEIPMFNRTHHFCSDVPHIPLMVGVKRQRDPRMELDLEEVKDWLPQIQETGIFAPAMKKRKLYYRNL